MMNIYEKIAAIMQDVQYLAKDDHVEFGSTKYKALSEEKVTSIMRAELLKHKLVVYPIAQTAGRTGNITHVDVIYRMVNVENPEEYIEIASCGDGADTQDKGAASKAMTYAFKCGCGPLRFPPARTRTKFLPPSWTRRSGTLLRCVSDVELTLCPSGSATAKCGR